jgi:hypothetical protein
MQSPLTPRRFGGTAIKRKNATWSLILSDGNEQTLKSEELLTSPNAFVQNAHLEPDSSERMKTMSKKKPIRNSEKKKKEKQCIQMAQDKQQEGEPKEFEKMMESIEGNGAWGFSDFKALIMQMREPSCCDIDGANVMVTPDDAIVVFDKAALGAIKRVSAIERGKKEENNQEGDGQPPTKRRRNTAAAERGLGLGCNKAHCQTDRCDRRQNANAQATKLKQDLDEKDVMRSFVTTFDGRKNKHSNALKQSAERRSHGSCPHVPFWVCQVTKMHSVFSCGCSCRCSFQNVGTGILAKQLQISGLAEEALATIENG